ncbi:MAG TPA: helix-turn-helix domain-containing protein [Streptosporangiaceae bacterium]|jgi:AcrR family transcriptional regulator
MSQEAGHDAASRAPGRGHPRQSHGGGIPAQERELGAQGRQTLRRLLDAGMEEFHLNGFQAVRVDDVVKRASTSHGTFYLYFKNKEDLFSTLLRDALRDMEVVTGDFPVVTQNEAGRAALRAWVGKFCDTYAAHAAVLRVLTQAEVISDDMWSDGLQLMFRLAEAMTTGMTAADAERVEHAELTAVACLMMLERVNFLFSVEVRLPREEMIDRIAAIIFAAFRN